MRKRKKGRLRKERKRKGKKKRERDKGKNKPEEERQTFYVSQHFVFSIICRSGWGRLKQKEISCISPQKLGVKSVM